MRRALCLGVMAALVCGTVSVAGAETTQLSYAGYNGSQTENANGLVAGMYWWDNTPDTADNSKDVWTFCIEPGNLIEDPSSSRFYTFDVLPVAGNDSRVLSALYYDGYDDENKKGADIKELWLENMDTMFSSRAGVEAGTYTGDSTGKAAASLQAAIWETIDPDSDWGDAWNAPDLLDGLDGDIDMPTGDEWDPEAGEVWEVYALIAQDPDQQNQAIVGFTTFSTPNIPVPVPAAAWPCIGLLSGLIGWKRLSNRKYRNA
ncbi:MAG: hypothetical protein ACLFVU_08325 [Phycisphaerae bacterium]